ncbi:hypothetical protein KUBF_29500 [Bacteroides finegoldii]|nr:hypothetical protein KUBF_29500 [Bacteroides finegoldii]
MTMKIIYKTMLLCVVVLSFFSCGNDDEPGIDTPPSNPELMVAEDALFVRIGEDTGAELEVLQGGGEYNAFSTNENIAKTEVVDGKIMIKGISIGKTYIVVSDKNGYYEKKPILVGLTDVIELDKTEVKIESLLNMSVYATVNITKGNGGYKVVSDNPKVTVSVSENGAITIMGKPEDIETPTTALVTVTDAIGITSVFDVCISAHRTDVLKLDETNVEAEGAVGKAFSVMINVVDGNGGYKVVSNNPEVSVSVTMSGAIKVTGILKSADTDLVATITVTDILNLKATCQIRIIPTDNPYTEEEIQTILSNSSRRYYLDDRDMITPGWKVNFKNVQQNMRITYGWEYYDYHFLLTFGNDRSEGKKIDATFSCYNYYYPSFIIYEEEPVVLEIIKNNGSRIWGVFSFTKDAVLHRGYFCDSI